MRVWLIGKILLHPVRALQQRIDAWVLARVRREAGPVTISRRRVYIVPTRYGYAFAALVVAMLLGSMNYSNSLGFLLCFLLAGLGLVSMHLTHANLVNVRVRRGAAEPVFAGESAVFALMLANRADRARLSLRCAWAGDDGGQTVDIDAHDETPAGLRKTGTKRGWLAAGIFSVSTDFPLGLFHAWTWIELEMRTLVYPRPAPPGRPLPPGQGRGGHAVSSAGGQEEFAGLRSYQRGDSVRTIHWKSLPKLATPMVKQFADSAGDALLLDWDRLDEPDTEARLAQLTRWVLDAEAAGRSYGLHLPGRHIAAAHGPAHRRRCLRALALFGQD